MPRKGQLTPRPPIGDASDPESLHDHMRRFSAWLREKNYSATTIASREVYLRFFIEWCDERGIKRPQEVTRPIIERYQRFIFVYRKKDGQPLSTSSQHIRITPIRAWFKWLASPSPQGLMVRRRKRRGHGVGPRPPTIRPPRGLPGSLHCPCPA
jgi:integrase/recombinase XerD